MAVPTNGNYLDNELTIVGKIHFNTHFTPLLEYSERIKDTHIKNEVMEVLEEKNTEYLHNVVMWKPSKPNTKSELMKDNILTGLEYILFEDKI